MVYVTVKEITKLADKEPSETVIVMLLVPAWILVGVPVSEPSDGLKSAHSGLLVIENARVLPSGSLADGL